MAGEGFEKLLALAANPPEQKPFEKALGTSFISTTTGAVERAQQERTRREQALLDIYKTGKFDIPEGLPETLHEPYKNLMQLLQQMKPRETPIYTQSVDSEGRTVLSPVVLPSGQQATKQTASIEKIPNQQSVLKLSQSDIDENVKSMKEGTPLSLLGGFGSQKSLINATYQREREKNPNLMTIPQLEVSFKSELARARTLNSQQTQNDLVSVQQFNSALDQALELSKQIPRTDFIPLNKLVQWSGTQFIATPGKYSTDVATMQALVVELANQGARVFSGTAQTDIKFKQDIARFNTAQTPEQFESIAEALRQIANTRAQTIINMPSYTPVEMNIKKQQQESLPESVNPADQRPPNKSQPTIHKVGKYFVEPQ